MDPQRELNLLLADARHVAEQGKKGHVDTYAYLAKAGVYASEHGLEVPQAEVEEIKSVLYDTQIRGHKTFVEPTLAHAYQQIQAGQIKASGRWLARAREDVREFGMWPNAHEYLLKLEELAYRSMVRPNLQAARRCIQEGNLPDARRNVMDANTFTEILGLKASFDVDTSARIIMFYQELPPEISELGVPPWAERNVLEAPSFYRF